MITGIFKVVFLLAFDLVKFFLSLGFYPLAYLFRKQARRRVYSYDSEYITHTVHGYEGMNKVPYKIIQKKPKRNILDWIARIVWFLLDDSSDWSDAGGSSFNKNIDTGIDQRSYGSYVAYREETEKYITNKYKRFIRSYLWALRNPMVNFTREYLVPRSKTVMYYIVKDSIGQYDEEEIFYNKEPFGTRYKVDSQGKFSKDRSLLGTQIYYSVTNDDKWYPCIESAGRNNLFGKVIWWDIWLGFLRGTLRYESAFRIGFEKA